MTDIRALIDELRAEGKVWREQVGEMPMFARAAAALEAQEAKITAALAEVEKVRRATFEGYWVDTVQSLKDIKRILSADAPTEPQGHDPYNCPRGYWTAKCLLDCPEHRDAPTEPAPDLERAGDGLNGVAAEDVREVLARVICGAVYGEPDNLSRASEATDAILARFHVTPKGHSNG